jgi:hypothetical protein
MRAFKTKTFGRWARKEKLPDASLAEAVRELRRGLVDARLGGGLVKKRLARAGGGKSGGYRTLIATDSHRRCVFLYGFAKSDRDNVDDEELAALKALAGALLGMTEETIERLVGAGELTEVEDGESQAA